MAPTFATDENWEQKIIHGNAEQPVPADFVEVDEASSVDSEEVIPTWQQMYSMWTRFYDAYRYLPKNEKSSSNLALFDKDISSEAVKHLKQVDITNFFDNINT